MTLLYKGDGKSYINDVPARDLTDEEVQGIADKWGLSLAETEGLLIQHKLYALVPKPSKKEAAKQPETKEE